MRKIVLSFVLLFVALSMSAIPARPGRIRVTQPDGSVIYITRHGDEWGHWVTDDQGRVVRKGTDGFYRPVAGMTADAARRQAALHRQALRRNHHFHVPSDHIAFDKKHFLVILVEFSDLSFTVEDPQKAFTDLLNGAGYRENGATGSARDYYMENSGGRFFPVFDVYGPVKLSESKSYYGGNNSSGDDLCPEEAVAEACKALEGQVDFSKYDNDDNATVDLVFMYYAGYGEADSEDEDAIWPHQWSLMQAGMDVTVDDNMRIDNYACTNELVGYGSQKGKMCGIGTACHEFAHAMGLPDFYDTDYATNGQAAGLFFFSLMDNGAYNNEGRTPPYLNIMERIMLGWLDDSAKEEISAAGEYSLESVNTNKAYMTPTDQDGEYFVYECRSDNGWDAFLPAHGLVVYHVDESAREVKIDGVGNVSAFDLWEYWGDTNAINENGSHPCFYVVPAVAQNDLLYGHSLYQGYYYFNDELAENIPFPGEGDVFTYTPKSWNGVPSSMSLSNIVYDDNTVTFTAKLPSDGLDYYSIKNPRVGTYPAGSSFALELDGPAGGSYSNVKWYFDDVEVSGPSVSLKAGNHTVEAEITFSDGKKQIVTLEIKVQ